MDLEYLALSWSSLAPHGICTCTCIYVPRIGPIICTFDFVPNSNNTFAQCFKGLSNYKFLTYIYMYMYTCISGGPVWKKKKLTCTCMYIQSDNLGAITKNANTMKVPVESDMYMHSCT